MLIEYTCTWRIDFKKLQVYFYFMQTITANYVANALGAYKPERDRESYLVECPCHDDHSPSLRITQYKNKILLYCLAGCDNRDIIVYLKSKGLWPTSNKQARLKHIERDRDNSLFRDYVVLAMNEINHIETLPYYDRVRILQAIRNLRSVFFIS